MTASEKKKVFQNILNDVLGEDDEENNKICVEIHSVLDDTLIANGSDPEEQSQKSNLRRTSLKIV